IVLEAWRDHAGVECTRRLCDGAFLGGLRLGDLVLVPSERVERPNLERNVEHVHLRRTLEALFLCDRRRGTPIDLNDSGLDVVPMRPDRITRNVVPDLPVRRLPVLDL